MEKFKYIKRKKIGLNNFMINKFGGSCKKLKIKYNNKKFSHWYSLDTTKELISLLETNPSIELG